jgi:diphthamide biosynthesis protein 3
MADEELNLYDEIEIEDCFYDATLQIYHHPCPCGDRFEISIADMRDGEDIARCPSCSLMIRIIFDQVRTAPCALQLCAALWLLTIALQSDLAPEHDDATQAAVDTATATVTVTA